MTQTVNVSLPARFCRGFTLIELIMVIVLLGVLSVFVAPRFLDINSFNQRGLYDQTIALLRYAHKSAIAQRRTVCANFTASPASLKLAIADAAGNTDCAATPELTGPRGETPASIDTSRIGGATYAGTPANLRFNGLGQPLDSTGAPLTTVQTITVTDGPAAITIQPVTGYVQ